MKAFTHANAADPRQAALLLRDARRQGRVATLSAGGSDLLGLIKDRVVSPDVIVSLRTVPGLDRVTESRDGVTIGGLITLDALAAHALVRERYPVLAEAAASVATPQIRNVGTLAGNVCQRPWCWYYRNGFPCYKAGGTTCFSVTGENQFHAIFGGGPSYIVHPSDCAPALVALEATFRLFGPSAERDVPAAEFFTLPRPNPSKENQLADDEVLVSVTLPRPRPGSRGTYHKVLDREAWTHAVVSAAVALDIDAGICRRARIVLGGVAPIPWRVQSAERKLEGQRLTSELATQAGDAAVEGAKPLAHNAYKVPMTRAVVARAILEAARLA
jgi:xanthine dehydrogenase YagS FAD-binding subunit